MNWKQNAFICVIGVMIGLALPLWPQYLDWEKQYAGPSNSNDQSKAVAIDRYNNVCVTGWSDNDMVTIAYHPNGDVAWLDNFSGTSDMDHGVDIAADLTGNVYVTGCSRHPSYNWDYVTVKYNALGQVQWYQYCDDGGGEYAVALTVDADGNVYITGQSNSQGGDDYLTLGYSPVGDELWNQPVHYNNGGADVPTAIT